MDIKIRLEEPKDYFEVENLTREAFWNLFKPGCDEHLLVHKMRKIPAFVKDLAYVALEGDKIVSAIFYAKAKIVDDKLKETEVLCLGPVCTLPSYQNKGIGAMLIEHTLKLAQELGFIAVVLYGHPGYYPRFGFVNAKEFNVQTHDGANFDAFMIKETIPGGLDGVSGRFYGDSVYELDLSETEEFDKKFPYKEKKVTDTQFE